MWIRLHRNSLRTIFQTRLFGAENEQLWAEAEAELAGPKVHEDTRGPLRCQEDSGVAACKLPPKELSRHEVRSTLADTDSSFHSNVAQRKELKSFYWRMALLHECRNTDGFTANDPSAKAKKREMGLFGSAPMRRQKYQHLPSEKDEVSRESILFLTLEDTANNGKREGAWLLF